MRGQEPDQEAKTLHQKLTAALSSTDIGNWTADFDTLALGLMPANFLFMEWKAPIAGLPSLNAFDTK
jgi:hypothetical protein